VPPRRRCCVSVAVRWVARCVLFVCATTCVVVSLVCASLLALLVCVKPLHRALVGPCMAGDVHEAFASRALRLYASIA